MTQESVFRTLWHRPLRRQDQAEDRRVTFLELFFDLVFVVVIARLAHGLAADPTLANFGWFVFLFFAVWSSWANGTFYHDSHGANDLSIRAFTFAQMLTVAAMAIYIEEIPGEGTTGFAYAYAANSLIQAVMWFRTGYHDPEHRPQSYPYATAYALSGLLFLVSAELGEPTVFILWATGLVFELGSPLVLRGRFEAASVDIEMLSSSAIERFGLFAIIVLGEVVVAAVDGVAEQSDKSADILIVGALGVLVAVGMWWLYFDFVSLRRPRQDAVFAWFYAHFPLVVGIAAGGAGVLNAVEHAKEPLPDDVRWLLVGSLVVALAAVAVLVPMLEVYAEQPGVYRTARVMMAVSAAAIILVGFTDFGPKATLASLVVLLLLPIAAGIAVFARAHRLGETAAHPDSP